MEQKTSLARTHSRGDPGQLPARTPAGSRTQVNVLGPAAGLVRVRAGERPPRPAAPLPRAWPPAGETCGGLLPSGRSRAGTRNRAMEATSGPREPRVRPRERDPDRHPRRDPDRHPERQRDRAGDQRRERNGSERRDGDRNRGRDRDPRQDRHRFGDHRPAEQRVREKPRQIRTRDGPQRPTWDAAPPTWPAPWETPEPPPHRKEDFGRRGPER